MASSFTIFTFDEGSIVGIENFGPKTAFEAKGTEISERRLPVVEQGVCCGKFIVQRSHNCEFISATCSEGGLS